MSFYFFAQFGLFLADLRFFPLLLPCGPLLGGPDLPPNAHSFLPTSPSQRAARRALRLPLDEVPENGRNRRKTSRLLAISKSLFYLLGLPRHQRDKKKTKFLQVRKDQRMHAPNSFPRSRAPRAPVPPSVTGRQPNTAQKRKGREGSKDAFAGHSSPAACLFVYCITDGGAGAHARGARERGNALGTEHPLILRHQ